MFSLKQAQKIVEHYQFLKGQDIMPDGLGFKIYDVFITPVKSSNLYLGFMNDWRNNIDPDVSLLGIDTFDVRVMASDGFNGRYDSDIDSYLSSKNI